MFKLLGRRAIIPFVLATAVLLRLCIGLHSYSGAHTPPRFGDYEAQRHWMEVTLNLPVKEWYSNSTDNDLDYWGLDYPPLSAYQSWLCGRLIQPFEPRAVALRRSRGYESAHSKLLLRWSVVISDVLVFFPAALAAAAVFGRGFGPARQAAALAAALLQPAALLIDHGHFQYNHLCLGLAAGAAAAVAAGRPRLGSALFCLALNHKQMALYFAPAFFAHLLGCALRLPGPAAKARRVAELGLVVAATFALCWAPFLIEPARARDVLRRLAPLGRGLFEDYVANFWCPTSALVKWRRLFSQQALVRMCAGCTLAALLPAAVAEARAPSAQGLLRCMGTSAFAFFLFAYQVHEKSILLPLLPATLLGATGDAGELALRAWLPAMAAFSMYPLLKKDRLTAAYAAALAAWAAVAWPPARPSPAAVRAGAAGGGGGRRRPRWGGAGVRAMTGSEAAVGASALGAALIHALGAARGAPARYPYLLDLLITSYSFVHFAGACVWLNMHALAAARTARHGTGT